MHIKSLKKLKTPKNKLISALAVLIGVLMLSTLIMYFGNGMKKIAGLALFAGSIFLLSYVYFKIFNPKLLQSPRQIFLVEIVILMMMAILIVVLSSQRLSIYFFPAGTAGILLTILINPATAGFAVFVIAILAGIAGGFSLPAFYVAVAGGFSAIYSSRKVRNRNDLNRSGLFILAVNIITIGALDMVSGSAAVEIGANIAWGGGNALACVIIASGVMPILESLFGITTDIRLLELGDFNRPLLKRLMLEAPGTYHHSLMVGNLAENACEKIGANPLLARVGAYYHDIGKLKTPHYFIENQLHVTDKHKNLNPSISALILKRHVKVGLSFAEEYNLDEVIKDMIAQHHGTTLIEYFYKKILEEAKDESDVDKKEYRYPGPRPKSKEAGVLMLADSVEAACRSQDEPTYSRITAVVTKVINNKFIDGQLNNCDLTLANLEGIQNSFLNTLAGIYHSRVEYPEDKEEKAG